MSYDKLVAALRECGERFFCNDCPYLKRAMVTLTEPCTMPPMR
jgi:hypothetical protein